MLTGLPYPLRARWSSTAASGCVEAVRWWEQRRRSGDGGECVESDYREDVCQGRAVVSDRLLAAAVAAV